MEAKPAGHDDVLGRTSVASEQKEVSRPAADLEEEAIAPPETTRGVENSLLDDAKEEAKRVKRNKHIHDHEHHIGSQEDGTSLRVGDVFPSHDYQSKQDMGWLNNHEFLSFIADWSLTILIGVLVVSYWRGVSDICLWVKVYRYPCDC